MKFTAKVIADFLHGEVQGNENVVVNNIAKIEEASEGTLAFLANPKYNNFLYSTKASIVLINKDFELEKKIEPTLIRVDDAYQSFASLLELYQQARFSNEGIEQPSYVDKSAKIGENAYVAAFAYISKGAKIGNNVKIYPHVFVGENVEIGENTILHSGSKIYFDCKIGKNCVIHSGTIIGSDGFGFAPQKQSAFRKIPQIGNVVIKDNVEIGSNTTIDRATIGSTVINENVKLDNLIQVAHNVAIDQNTVIAAQTGISGSTKVGKNCMIGGQVGIVGHISLADEVKLGAQSGVSKSIKQKGAIYHGSPAFPIQDYYKSQIFHRKLPQINQKIEDLEKQIEMLKAELLHETF